MLASRTLQKAFQLSGRQTTSFLLPAHYAPLTAVKATSTYHFRSTATVAPTTADEAHRLLVYQRLKRPVSPHLSIYQPQLTWYISGLNRIAGVSLAGATYLFALGYLASPYVGWHLESATLAAAFGSLPVVAKVGIKAIAAAPFSFHCWNGLRHLVWDTGKELTLKGVYRTGYVVLGLTGLSTIALALM